MSTDTGDIQKEEFRKYLEKYQIVQQLTKVLVDLYEEPPQPSTAIEHIKRCLKAPTDKDIDLLQADIEELTLENAELESKVEGLSKQLKELQAEQEQDA
mmetsp:Transcript_63884/g.101265  ORF Transcript_63884/g.101265 Transcript_63884/m.101265 type:complete len:99 (+) Transcript_63884:58-354(+)|eukprot:CAMPEP_0169129696 /NCGR_PEP_ID=MMETSP1015-20121227/37285_1 /TAXON_ID=342587 /ORGANISM="Karlodinium micrum, Strain CCMP2283" /LENGTH=98 /DNA_ID=CAMNT_0009193775 /DNA_START=41 /DNA_END=337 /DNA_ORIENTATION=+